MTMQAQENEPCDHLHDTHPPCVLLTEAKDAVSLYEILPSDETTGAAATASSSDAVASRGTHLTEYQSIGPEELRFNLLQSWPASQGPPVSCFAPRGNWLAVPITASTLRLVETSYPRSRRTAKFSEVAILQTGGTVKRTYFSPKGTYLVVLLANPTGVSSNDTTTGKPYDRKNVEVWSTEGRSLVTRLGAKSQIATDERWSPIEWSSEETFCFRQLAEALHVYPGTVSEDENWKACFKIEVERLRAFRVSPELSSGGINVVVFSAQSKQLAAKCIIYGIKTLTDESPVMLSSKTLAQVENVSLQWNASGTAVLATTFNDVDKTGKSYYGTSSLYYLSASGSGPPSVQLISCAAGPIADTQWSPVSSEFVVISGSGSPKIVLYDAKCEPHLDFGNIRRNMIRFNPFGRFVCLGGSGNLPGEFNIWDRTKQNVIGSGKATCPVDCEWAPHGRYIFFSTTSPRLRVDNGVKIHRYNGDLLATLSIPELYSVAWLPSPPRLFPNRAPSRGRQAAVIPPTVTTAYRPPRMSSEFEARLLAERQLAAPPKSATVVNKPAPAGGVPPGATPVMSKSAKRNAARRRKEQFERNEAAL